MASHTSADALNVFLDAHLLELIIIGGVIIGFIFLYRMMRKVPVQPDFTRIFHEMNIDDEKLNKPNKYDPKHLYHGNQKLGFIISLDTQKYDYKPTQEERDKSKGGEMWNSFKKEITTIVFKKDWYNIPYGEKTMILLEKGEWVRQDEKLVIPQNVGLTALGNTYVSKGSFDETSRIVDGSFQKRLFESNVNVMASRMSHISSESPEMAFQLNLKRLEIDKIRAEKETKMGGLI